jgi:hypothetical protein
MTPPEPDPNRSRPEPQAAGKSQVLVDRQLAGRLWPRACVPDSARARPTPKPTRAECRWENTSTCRSPAGWAALAAGACPDPARARPEPKPTRAAGRWEITSTCRSAVGWAPVAAGMCARLHPSPTHAEADPSRMPLGKHKYLSIASWMGAPGRGHV